MNKVVKVENNAVENTAVENVAPIVENVAPVTVAAPVTNPHAHLMRDLSHEEIKALSKEDQKAYVRLNTPRWREKAHTEVTGVFKNLENRGGSVTFNFPIFPGEDFRLWTFRDGDHCRIPHSIAVHLNDDCYYKEYQEVKGDFGRERVQGAMHNGQARSANMQMASKVYRYAFHSLEFSRQELSVTRSTLALPYMSN